MGKAVWELSVDLIMRFRNDDIMSSAAQTAYYFVFSLFPFLLFIVTMIGYIPQLSHIDNLDFLAEFIQRNAYQILNSLWEEIVANRSGTLLSFGLVVAIWISSAGVKSLICGFNRAYDQDENRGFILKELVAINFTIQFSLVIITALILIVFGELIGRQLAALMGLAHPTVALWENYRIIIALLTLVIAFVFLYHGTPNLHLRMRDVIPGAIAAALGWLIISIGFAVYANNFAHYSVVYGSLGGAIVLLLWFYLSAIIILMGAELNAALAFRKNNMEKRQLPQF